ncbi:cytochrome P450 [Xylaria digitata]|nr:cytochrome P450 [Xylaria digitata]
MDSRQVLSLIVTYAVACIIPILFLSASRLIFHPLRNYPGPFFARLTDAYSGYFAINKCLHLKTYHNFQKYGPVPRQAPNRLVFNTVTALHDIYLNPKVTKGDSYRSSQLRAKYPSIINAIDRDQRRRKRKFIGQALNERLMRRFEPVMSHQIDISLKMLLWSSEKGNPIPINISKQCQYLGVDIIGLRAFGHQFKTQTEDSFRFIPQVIDAMSWRINTYMHFPLLSYLENVLAILGKGQVIRFGDAVTGMIKTRMAQDKDAHHDLYSIVADYLWPEAILFIMAGGTTTATTMSAMLFYFSKNPEVYSTLATEIRSGSQLNSCKYLRACIDETLRIDYGNDPFIVDGHVIPPGTQVGVSLYSLFHNEEYFPDSFTFRPERWLGGPVGGEDAVPGHETTITTIRKAFVPFLIGDRACAGKPMAYLEASLTLARVLWFFDFELAPGQVESSGARKPGRTDGRDRWRTLERD